MNYLTYYYALLIGLIGLVLGSFLNCWADRIVKGTSIIKGRSKCDSCDHTLAFIDLIPVLSWVINKGKCRYCNTKISIFYPLTEIICCIGFIGIFIKYGLTIECLKWLFLFCVLFVISLVDLYDGWIPDRFIVVLIIGFILFNINKLNNLTNGIISGLVIFVGLYAFVMIFNKIKKVDSMGGGDLKLFFVVGLYFGIIKTLFSMFISCIVGIIFAYITNSKDKTFPFAPSIAIASYIVLIFGDLFLNWYLSLL